MSVEPSRVGSGLGVTGSRLVDGLGAICSVLLALPRTGVRLVAACAGVRLAAARILPGLAVARSLPGFLALAFAVFFFELSRFSQVALRVFDGELLFGMMY